MKIVRYLLPAAFVAVLGASGASASAFPVQSTQAAIDAAKIEVQYGERRGPPPGASRKGQGPSHMHRRGPPPHMHRPPPPRYVPGRRYNSAPHGWRRYGARPGDWRMRGCVMVGPMWFCP
jgi:hypothetical protein